MSENLSNSKYRDSSSKIIFEDPTLCAQFLKGYLDIPLLKDVKPEDIEDVTSRYVHLFSEERNSDVVKRVHIRFDEYGHPKEMPFYLISLIEHKSNVDYDVTMKVITLYHIPRGIFVLTLHENPGLACAKLHALRSLCASN